MNQIKHINNVVKTNLNSILKIDFLSLIVVFIYSYFIAEKSYISTSKLFVYGENASSVSELKSLAMQYGISTPGGSSESNFNSPDLFINLSKSRDVLYKLLDSNFEIDNEIISLKNYLSKGKDKHIAELYIKINKKISVGLDKRSGIISSNVSMNTPDLAFQVNEKLIELVNERFIGIKKSQTSLKKIFIQERIIALESELSDVEEEIKTFKEKNKVYISSPELTLQLNRLIRNSIVIEKLYLMLKEQLQSITIEEIENAKPLIVIDTATLPHKKSSPVTTYNLIYAFILSSFLSVGYYSSKSEKYFQV